MPMTITEILHTDKEMLSAADISKVLGMHVTRINYYAHTNQLPFPFILSGKRVKIPRQQFIKFMGYTTKEEA